MLRWLTVLAVFLVLGGLWWLVARRRSPDRRRTFGLVASVSGTLPWIWMILTPSSHARRVHLDPVSGLGGILASGFAEAAVQIVGNLLVFAAFGAFAPLRWPRLTLGPVLLLAAAGSATVELLQYVLDLGRVTATDDVLVNTLGAGLAYGAGRLLPPGPVSRGLDVEPLVGHEGGEPVLGQR
ncbi:hypothetical protein GCM10009827_064580 [Dactylosporangium maewongense]|uniref:VanZ-like domain-containing protein n=1 Tax=Dactylosporangium maewongense TaxID=634393 RepID=A0ABP4M4F6_9ACTN